jgi:CO/xanthine dehydrogenase FAD-binding subunit
MRAYLPSFELRRARSLTEALAVLSSPPGTWRPLAGGTDVMVQLAAGTLSHQRFVSVWGIPELRQIDIHEDAVRMGSLTTFTDVLRHPVLRAEFPLLGRAAEETGGIANQNRGTVGGNIANASPAADTPPALLVYDAELELASTRGARRVPYHRFHIGYKQMDLAADELIAAIWLPRRPHRVQHYRKVGPRLAQAISKVCFAAAASLHDGGVVDIRLAFGSVAPTVVRASKTEAILRGAALGQSTIEASVKALNSELAPIDDIRSTASYRKRVAANLLVEFIETLQHTAAGRGSP